MKTPKTLFREYFRARIAKSGMPKGEDLEDLIAGCSAEWEETPCSEYGGMTPRAYFATLTDADVLTEMLVTDIKEGGDPLALIAERLAELPEAVRPLCAFVTGDEREDIRIAAAELLWRMDKVPVETFVDLAFDGDAPEALRERIIEVLSQCGSAVYDAVMPRTEHLSGDAALIAGELLVSSGVTNDGVCDFLLRLTDDPQTLPRALQLIASYGDFRAVPALKKLARTCDYATYTDIRSAVEMIGGEMDVERDWTGDATYALIKGGK